MISLYRVELRRLALSKYSWIAASLCLCAPLLGYSMYQMSSAIITTNQYIVNPVLAGTTIGALLWALLALLETDRVYRAKTDVLVDAIASPVIMALVRIAALVTLAAVVCALCVLAYLPYTIVKMDYLFDFGLYAVTFFTVMLPTWWVSILLSCAFYQITRRIELAGLLYGACAYISVSRFVAGDFFPRWLNPLINTYSDGFSSLYFLRIAFYTRVLWLCLSGGAYALSLMCVYRYQRNLMFSILRGLKKKTLPAVSTALLAAGVLLWSRQPFVDHGPAEWGDRDDELHEKYGYGNSDNDTTASAFTYRLTTKPATGRLHGIAEYTISPSQSGSDSSRKSVGLNWGYTIKRIVCDEKEVNFETTKDVLYDMRWTTFMPPQGEWKTLTIEFEGYPGMLRCFAPYTWGSEVTRDYVCLNNASAMPRLTGITAPQSFTLELVLPGNLVPIANHCFLTDFIENADGIYANGIYASGTKTWKGAVSGRSLWITAADYMMDTFNAASMDIDFVYSKKYEKVIKEHNILGALADVFNWCTDRLGKLSWAGDRNLLMVQRSEISGGGNAGEGWVEWGEAVFTPFNLNDPLKGASAAEVFVHEMVHQWWGGLGVLCGWSEGPWTDEGLTVYTTYRLMKDKYGEEYAKKYYIDVWQDAVDKQERSFYYRNPEYLDRLPERYRAEMNYGYMGTNHYCRMPLMILKAEQLVGGEEKMDAILRAIQSEYERDGHFFTFQDFLDYCKLTEEDLILDKNF